MDHQRMIDGHPAKLIKGRAALISQKIFWGSLSLGLELKADPSIETACTDGATLAYNPDWIATLTEPQCTGLWMHEVAHCALGHLWRVGARDEALFNVACDYVVNEIADAEAATLPEGALRNPAFHGKSAEEIYTILGNQPKAPEDAQGSPGSGANGSTPTPTPGKFGEFTRAPAGASPSEIQAIKDQWEIATIQAATVAAQAGDMPAHLARALDAARKPVVDWKELLRKFLTNAVPSDYAWNPPNKRMVAQDIYLPGLRAERLSCVGFFVDSSGSVTDQQLAQVKGEFNAILDDCQPESVIAIACDASIKGTPQEFEPGDYPVDLEIQGGGGTDFRPPFAWIERDGRALACAIYLTDLDAPPARFPADPGYPVLWISTTRRTAPFGATVYLDPSL